MDTLLKGLYERAMFNRREGETVNAFITALHTQAEKCAYGVLKEDSSQHSRCDFVTKTSARLSTVTQAREAKKPENLSKRI